MIEADVKRQVKRILERDYGKFTYWSYWPVQTGFGKHGIPDCLMSILGYMVAIETKVNSKAPTTRQWHELGEIEKSQGIALVIDQDNIGDISHVLNALIHGNIHEARHRAKCSISAYKSRAI